MVTLSVSQLANAQRVTTELLEALGLNAYRFEVAPEGDHWLVRLECAVDEGWMSTQLSVEGNLLEQSGKDPEVRKQLLQTWREHLETCHKKN